MTRHLIPASSSDEHDLSWGDLRATPDHKRWVKANYRRRERRHLGRSVWEGWT